MKYFIILCHQGLVSNSPLLTILLLSLPSGWTKVQNPAEFCLDLSSCLDLLTGIELVGQTSVKWMKLKEHCLLPLSRESFIRKHFKVPPSSICFGNHTRRHPPSITSSKSAGTPGGGGVAVQRGGRLGQAEVDKGGQPSTASRTVSRCFPEAETWSLDPQARTVGRGNFL